MKKKFEMNSKTIANIAAAVVTVGSVIAVADFAERKRKGKNAHSAELILGISGLLLGSTLTVIANKPARHKIIVEDMFDDEDVQLINEQIRETLDFSPERDAAKRDHVRTIELDEETSIEDFI